MQVNKLRNEFTGFCDSLSTEWMISFRERRTLCGSVISLLFGCVQLVQLILNFFCRYFVAARWFKKLTEINGIWLIWLTVCIRIKKICALSGTIRIVIPARNRPDTVHQINQSLHQKNINLTTLELLRLFFLITA